MAKKQSGKKSAKVQRGKSGSTVKEFINKHLVLILGTSVIVLSIAMVFLFWGINQYNTQQAINDQRKQFDTAEASLDALYAQIAKEVGKPTKVKKDKYCSYASTKLDQGRRSCGIHYYFQYGNFTEPITANQLKKQVETVLNNNSDLYSTYASNKVFSNQNSRDDNSQVYNIKLNGDSQFRCYLSIDYMIKDATSYPTIVNTHSEVALACSADALSEFYPVKD